MVVGVIAPSVRVIAGVVVGVATDPDTPFAVVTEKLVTVPVPADGVGILSVSPTSVAAPLPVVVRTISFFMLQEVARSVLTIEVKSAEAPEGIAIRNTAVAV